MESIERFLLFAPVVLFSMVAHEYAHGYAAHRHGDDTALLLGRLTWNPLRHIDPFLTVAMPALTFFMSQGTFMFGGAKPVPVDPSRYRHGARSDIIVSLAGIASNIALAVALVAVIVVLGLLGRAVPVLSTSLALLQVMFVFGIFFNLLLAVFNLLPVPPLDGSHVMKYLLPPVWSARYQRLGGLGFLFVILLITIGRPIFEVWMSPVSNLYGMASRVISPFLLTSRWVP